MALLLVRRNCGLASVGAYGGLTTRRYAGHHHERQMMPLERTGVFTFVCVAGFLPRLDDRERWAEL
jgi:hypothetical protein